MQFDDWLKEEETRIAKQRGGVVATVLGLHVKELTLEEAQEALRSEQQTRITRGGRQASVAIDTQALESIRAKDGRSGNRISIHGEMDPSMWSQTMKRGRCSIKAAQRFAAVLGVAADDFIRKEDG